MSTDFTVNPNFDGNLNINLLSGGDMLEVGEMGTIQIELTVTPSADQGPYFNTATGQGISPAGTTVEDDSQNGTDVDPDDPNDIDPTDNNEPTSINFPCVADAGDLITTTATSGWPGFEICQGEDLLNNTMSSLTFSPDYSANDELNPGPGYDVIIILVNEDGEIVETQLSPADFNFLILPPGTFTVYSLSYFSNNPLNLNSYLSGITGDGDPNDVAQIEADDVAGILCLDLDNGTPFSTPFTISINSLPVAGPITGPTEVCLNETIILDGNPTGGTAPFTHTWVITGGTGSANLINNNDGTVEIMGTVDGQVELSYSLVDGNGCSSTSIAAYLVTVHSIVTPSIFITGGIINPTSCGGNTGAIIIGGLVSGETYSVTYTQDGAPMMYGPVTAVLGAFVIPDLVAGNYDDFVTTNISSGCVSNIIAGGPFVLDDPLPDEPVLNFITATNPSTCGGNDGKITIGNLTDGVIYSVLSWLLRTFRKRCGCGLHLIRVVIIVRAIRVGTLGGGVCSSIVSRTCSLYGCEIVDTGRSSWRYSKAYTHRSHLPYSKALT